MKRFTNIAGIFALALTTSACSMAGKMAQDRVSETPRASYETTSAVSSKRVAPADSLNVLDIQQVNAVSTIQTVAPTSTATTAKPIDVSGIVSKAEKPAQTPLIAASAPGFRVTDVQVTVPDHLVVSEAEVYVPQADIVWREDPLGDRKAQVKTIMENALTAGTSGFDGGQEVILKAEMITFHALTDKARAVLGGKHNVQFNYVLVDAATGAPVTETKHVDSSLKAYGGRRAYKAMRKGQTKKVRISEHVAKVVKDQLSEG